MTYQTIITIDITFEDNSFSLDVEFEVDETVAGTDSANIKLHYVFNHFNDITKIDLTDPRYHFE